VTTLVQRNTASVIEVNQSIADAHREASQGGRIVDEAVAAMTKIQHSSQEIGQMTQQNAAMVEQSNATAQSLADEAGRLAGNVSRFRINDGGARPAPVHVPPAPIQRARPANPAPVAHGNLALKARPDDDWSEF
jgi:methyl-accepting chemotaxis protein